MSKRGVKDEHFITPQGWKEIAVLFAKEASKEQRGICSESAEIDYDSEDCTDSGLNSSAFYIDKESILNAKSPV